MTSHLTPSLNTGKISKDDKILIEKKESNAKKVLNFLLNSGKRVDFNWSHFT